MELTLIFLKLSVIYNIDNYCRCEDPLCSTVKMSSPALIGKDGAFANAFNIAWVIINFFPDGKMEIENLADRGCDFPFRQEIRNIFSGVKMEYDDNHASEIVDVFMAKLERQEVRRIEV